MSQHPCDKCGELVSASKAFCPACGHAMVEEEKRESASEFQRLDGTMQVGQTMYNQMLSEMGLNISVPTEQSTDAVKPVLSKLAPAAEASSAAQLAKPVVIEPIGTEKLKPAAAAHVSARRDRTKLLLVVGGILVAGWLLILLLFGFFAILPRLR